jgi:mannose-1-phosphate guanylyltransferase
MVNLHHCPETIREVLKDGSELRVKIFYSYEDKILGTAGALKKVEDFLKDRFILINSDIIINLNINKFYSFHKERGFLATMALGMRKERGDIVYDKDYCIKSILGRPFKEEDSYLKGDYLGLSIIEKEFLRYIPNIDYYELNNQIFPLILEKGGKIGAYIYNGYFKDIGKIEDYFRVHRDFLEEKIDFLNIELRNEDGFWKGKDIFISKEAKIDIPVFIGNNSIIEKGARVGRYTVIGNNCKVGEEVDLEECILFDRVEINKKGVSLKKKIIDRNFEMD